MKQFELKIPQEFYDLVMDARQRLLVDYEINEYQLLDYVAKHPSSAKVEEVEEKIHLLNTFYSTRVPAKQMAKHICKIQDIDKRLACGDTTLVTEIAQMGKQYYSFATKYCAIHQPDKFPIYDKLVWQFFVELKKRNFFDPKTAKKFAKIKADYKNYVDIYDEFMRKIGLKSLGLSYRQVDKLIWGVIKLYILFKRKPLPPYVVKILDSIFASFIGSLLVEILKNSEII